MTAIENIINQIENETRRFGNTKTRVAAVLRLIKAKLVDLFSGKLDKGRYAGTADDLNNAIGNKVDKVPGKILSSNDFTDAYKQKLDTLEDYDIELDENTTELRFKRGSNVVRRISLMFLDDEGTKLVYNKPEKTLELRDKRNNLLTSIPVSHFVSNIPDGIVVQNGKIKLMAGNNVIFENAFSYNDLADKPDLNFAPASHRHNWDDIDGKPEIATYKTITDAHKFLDKDGAIHFGSGSGIANAPGSSYYEMLGLTHSSKGWGFIIAKNLDVNDRKLYIKQVISGSYTGWFELNGNSENISIRDYIECNHSHNGSVIFVENPLTIQLKDLVSLDCVSFRKVFAGGQVTFTCDGKQIIYTGDTAFNGGDGSTAVVSIWNNKCYIDIRNI
jgi:hypothetical protein